MRWGDVLGAAATAEVHTWCGGRELPLVHFIKPLLFTSYFSCLLLS